MLGAIIGDIAGSRFEFDNTFDYGFELFSDKCGYTDDTICTVAIADAILKSADMRENVLTWCRRHPNPMGSYGGSFARWLKSTNPQPYYSFGNGAAMRVSPTAWLSNSESETIRQAVASAEFSHNHPEGLIGAVAVALGIRRWRHGDTEGVGKLIDTCYGADWRRNIPPSGHFDETCQGCVPLSFHIIEESADFENAVRRAVSYGGDCDTVGAIAGSLAEARWGIPEWIRRKAMEYLPEDMRAVIDEFYKNTRI